ncbi:MAG TPA: YciI family protein [Acidimicrobiales bacterium]
MTVYLLSVHITEGQDTYATPEEERQAYADTDALGRKMIDEGVWVFGGGLHPVETATVVDATKGQDVLVTDGPFAEAKEHIAGFWVIKAADLDEAMRWAQEASAACRAPVEVRPFEDDTPA